MKLKEKILNALEDGRKALQQLSQKDTIETIEQGAYLLASCFQKGNKVLIAGNGGSLCDSAHFAEELAGFFRKKRPALPAMALSEPALLSCIANDLGFEFIFSRAIEAYGKPGDLFIGLSTSGNSSNIIHGLRKAREMGLDTMAFLGKGGGKAKEMADWELIIDGFDTSDRIQEAHMIAIHTIIELVEDILFYKHGSNAEPEILAAVSH